MESEPRRSCRRAEQPPLKFELLAVHVGVNRVGLAYRSVGRRFALEIVTLDDARRITHVVATYGDSDAEGFGRSVLALTS